METLGLQPARNPAREWPAYRAQARSRFLPVSNRKGKRSARVQRRRPNPVGPSRRCLAHTSQPRHGCWHPRPQGGAQKDFDSAAAITRHPLRRDELTHDCYWQSLVALHVSWPSHPIVSLRCHLAQEARSGFPIRPGTQIRTNGKDSKTQAGTRRD